MKILRLIFSLSIAQLNTYELHINQLTSINIFFLFYISNWLTRFEFSGIS